MNIEVEDGMCCGVLSIMLSESAKDYLFLFRNEIVRSMIWAGEPKKIDDNGVLNPRASFAQWKEIKKGKSLPWKPEEVDYATRLQSAIARYVDRWSAEKMRVDAEIEREQKEKLQREQEVIKQSALMHNNFLATISHELRTPIHSILGNTERLTDLLNNNTDAGQCIKMIQT